MGDLSKVEPQTKAFLDKIAAQGGKPIYRLSPKEARHVLTDLQGPEAKLPVDIQDMEIPGPKGQVKIRILRPSGKTEKLPAVVYCHGGGWILGNKQTHHRLVADIATAAQVAIVFVDYSLSPEAQHPVAVEEVYAVAEYVSKNGGQLNLDPAKLVIAGDSAGGDLAAVVALLAKERKGPKFLAQLLFYPVTDANLNTESYQKNGEGLWLTKPAMEWFWNAYQPDLNARKQSNVSPLKATNEQLKGLPRTLVITVENDVLRDEGEAYAHKLMQAGVEVSAVRYLGTIHDFLILTPLEKTPAVKSALLLIKATLQDILRTG